MNQVRYSKNLISNIKYRIATSKFNNYDKKKITLIICDSVASRRRAPIKSLSFYDDHYNRHYMTPGTKEVSKAQIGCEKKVSEIESFFNEHSNSILATGSRAFVKKRC